MFLDIWKEINNKDWTNDSDAAKYFLDGTGKDIRDKLKIVQQTSLDTGNSAEWDITLLGIILSSKPFLQLLKKQKKTQPIQTLSSIRNEVNHFASVKVSDEKFTELSNKLVSILVSLGASLDYFENLKKNTKDFKEQDRRNENAQKLKESGNGNGEFKSKNYKKAIELYTSAIVLPNLSNQEVGILYCNRSIAYMRLYEEFKDERELYRAISDANQSISYYPVWYKGYARLGEIYYLMNELDKSKENYEKALAFSPGNEELSNSLNYVKVKMGEQSRQEHLNRQHAPTTIEESEEIMIDLLKNKKGLNNTTSEEMKELIDTLKNISLEEDPVLQDVWKGHEYRDGSKEVKQNYEIAAKHYSKAAQKGNAEAIYSLALLTMRGYGVIKDYKAAITLLEEAAKQKPTRLLGKTLIPNVGVAEAEHSLGLAYQQGTGVLMNEQIAVHWYELAVEHSNPNAANNLGLMYFNGSGVDKDNERAERLFILAHERGNPVASGNLVELYIEENDPERAIMWHERSLESDFYYPKTRDEEIRRQINQLQELKTELDKNPEEKQKVEEAQKFIKNMTNFFGVGLSPLVTKQRDYDREKLLKCANEGSITAKSMVDAIDNFNKAIFMFIHVEANNIPEFLAYLSFAYTTSQIVCKMNYNHAILIDDLLKSVMKKNQNCKNPVDYHARICYAYMNCTDPNFINNFLNSSLKIYPNDLKFLVIRGQANRFLQKYENSLQDFNAALKLDPNDYDILFDKAVVLRLSNLNEPAIDYYKQFLEKAPIDHRKVPEAYYAIALCNLTENRHEEANNYYMKGLESEKHQLFCFMPYKCNFKAILEPLLKISSISDIEKGINMKEKEKEIYNDPMRVSVIRNHRELKKYSGLFKDNYKLNATYKPNKTQKMPSSINGLREVVFKDMDFSKDHIMNGFMLTVINIDEPIIGVLPSVHFVVEDKYQYVQKLCIYNMGNDFKSIKDRFPIGCEFSIINPYIRLATDGRSMIRVDDPNTVLMSSGSIKADMCRYCGKEDSKFSCAKCKKAKYCSKKCQTNDWKILNHKNACLE